jgi:hypothetical protein
MPDFLLPDPSGKTAKRSEVTRDNKIVMVNFWASWRCPAAWKCRAWKTLQRAEKQKLYHFGIGEDKDRPQAGCISKTKTGEFSYLYRPGRCAGQTV